MKKMVVGIEQDGGGFSAAFISACRGKYIADRLETVSTPSCLSLSTSHLIATGVEGGEVLVRHLCFPLKKRSAIEKTLPLQLESIIHQSLDPFIVRSLYQPQGAQTKVTAFIIAKKRVEHFLRHLPEISPDWISCLPAALCRFGQWTFPSLPSFLIFHLGENLASFVGVKEHSVHAYLSLPMGMHDLTSAYQEGRKKEGQEVFACEEGNNPLSSWDRKRDSYFAQKFDQFVKKVDHLFCALTNGEEDLPYPYLICTGMTDRVCSLEAELLALPSAPPNGLPQERIVQENFPLLKRYAVAIGYGLEAWKDDRSSVQFLTKGLATERMLGKMRRKFLKGAALCAGIFLSLCIGALVALKSKSTGLSRMLENKGPLSEQMVAEKGSRMLPLDQRVRNYVRGIDRLRRVHPYFVPPPLVSHLLSYLEHHGTLMQAVRESQVRVEELHYALVDYPSATNTQARYVIRVELVLHSPNEDWPLKLYQALSKGDHYIDSRSKVEWSKIGEGQHRIIFFVNPSAVGHV